MENDKLARAASRPIPWLRALLSATLCLASVPLSGCRDKTPAPAAAPLPAGTGVAAATTAPEVAKLTNEPPLGQLPDDVTPRRYTLALDVRPDAPAFTGTVRIDVTLRRALSSFWMHGRNLTVRSVQLQRAGKATLNGQWRLADPEGVAEVTLSGPADAGDATLVLTYRGAWNGNLRGLYRATEQGATYAFTQFEPMSARYAFPAFDEPRFKTPFDIALTVPRGHVAITNNPEKSRVAAGPDTETVTFATSAPLPTYLVAMAVGPFDVVEGAPVPPTEARKTALPLRGVAARGKGKQLAYALARTGELLRTSESYFGVAYPYAKLDLIAVPEFSAGAMENPGAITFRESLLLIEPERASLDVKRAFAGVMAHELAHMWFGDLVTLRWWDDTWLNEGFASWMTLRALGLWRPALRSDLRAAENAAAVMRSDALAAARQVRQPILTHHDVRNAFDDITYKKGAALLGMFERWVGEEPFRRGVRGYLQKHRFGNATSEDFLAALSAGAGRDVSAAFRTFLEQPGVPLVRVKPQCTRGGDKPARIQLSQERYRPIGSATAASGLWQIPVCLRYLGTSGARSHCALLERAQMELELPETRGCPAWLHPNADGAGYYRFTLPPGGLAELRAAAPSLTARERFVLADNLSAGLSAGLVPVAEALGELPSFTDAAESLVAKAPMELLEMLRERVLPDAQRPRLEAAARAMYRPVLERLGGFEAALTGKGPALSLDARSLRNSVVEFLAETGRDLRVRQALSRAGAAMLESRAQPAIAPGLVKLALALALEEGDARRIELAAAKLRAGPSPTMRNDLVFALGRVWRGGLADKARALMLDDKVMRANEVVLFWLAHLGEEGPRAGAWDWLRANYDALMKRIPSGHASYLVKLLGKFCDEARGKELAAFFGPRIDRVPGGPRSLQAASEAIALCAARVKAIGADVLAYYASPAPSSGARK